MPGFEPRRNADQAARGLVQRRSLRPAPGLLARLREARRRDTGLETNHAPAGAHGFLVGRVIDAATMARAEAEAHRSGQDILSVLLALGWVVEADYVRLLAGGLGTDWRTADPGWSRARLATGQGGRAATDVEVIEAGRACRLVAAADLSVSALDAAMRPEPGQLPPLLVTRHAYGQALALAADRYLRQEAVDGLARRRPEISARGRVWWWQAVAFALLGGLTAGAALFQPVQTIGLLTALLTLPFLAIVVARCLALWHMLSGRDVETAVRAARLADVELPIYTILVPLFREVRVLPQLTRALMALDYPASKLDIMLVLESVDAPMRAAVAALDLPGSFRVVVVPDCQPRTKPKALNYALHFARGSYVVVFDAEDKPEPDQLRRALAVLAAGPPTLVCVQACLNVDNARASWLTRQFALEYSVLFDALLPALARIGAPVPLGGTSNHFRLTALRRLGGWDPYNVTEDADLGVRIARAGLVTRTIRSTTWEEAPRTLGSWVKQRTRWLKGWMQTWLVHMRAPRQLLAELGLGGFLGFQLVLGGIVMSVVAHPWVYVVGAWEWQAGRLWGQSEGWLASAFWWIAFATLCTGHLVSMLAGALAAIRRRHWHLVAAVILMPAYWLLISVAAYRALWQLVRDPFRWEKTEHGE